MLEVIELVLPLFGLIFLGFAAGKLAKRPIASLEWMNIFIIYVALPAMFYRLLSQTPVSEFTNYRFLAATTAGTLIVFLMTMLIAGFGNRLNIRESTIQGFAGAYGNIGYMGPPLAIAAFGPEAGVPVALVFCLDNSMHFTLAPLLMGVDDGGKVGRLRLVGGILRKIFTHPFILATIAGILGAAFKLDLPSSADTILLLLGNAAAPCALFVMGVTAAVRPIRRIPLELGYLIPIKLIVHPAVVFGLLTLAGDFDPLWVNSAVLLAALPAATNVFVIAQQYQTWQERASSAVILSTALAMFTVPVFLYIVKSGYLL